MVSIGKLAGAQADYYLEEADDRIDAAKSVADGIEDYYVGGKEARGEWIGSPGREVGLSGPVDADDLRRVFAGLDPRDGSPLRAASSRATVGAFDLTFSAPKSVSVLYGVGDDAMRG